jgi:hypothetical protein
LKWVFVDFVGGFAKAPAPPVCLFLSTLFGQKRMELMMLSAIKNTRAMTGGSDRDQ